MNDNNVNPRYPVNNHYHHFPVNHYNYYYPNNNNLNNVNNSNQPQPPEYSRNHALTTQILPTIPSPSPHVNNSARSERTSSRTNFSGSSRITSQNHFQEHQTYNQTRPQTSLVGNSRPRPTSQTNSSSENRRPRPTSQTNSFSESRRSTRTTSQTNSFSENRRPRSTSQTNSFSENRRPRPTSQTNSFSENRRPRPTSQTNSFSENGRPRPTSQTNSFSENRRPRPTSFLENSSQNSTQRHNVPLRSDVPGSSSSIQSQTNQINNANNSNERLRSTVIVVPPRVPTNVQVNNGSSESPLLHFNLRESYNDKTKFSITDEERACFRTVIDTAKNYCGTITGRFCCFIDRSSPPTAEQLMITAKHIILITQKYGCAAVMSLERVIFRRLKGECGNWKENSIVKKMTLFYLLNLVVEAESVNFDSKSGRDELWKGIFENLIGFHDNFGSLIAQASADEKQQVYYLRSKWNTYISNGTSNESDRPFWINVEIDKLLSNQPNTSQQINAGQTAVSYAKDTIDFEVDENDDADNLGHFNRAIDQFLQFDWLLEFPISEKDKQKFTEKYSVEKPSGKDSVYIYDRNVDFNMSNFQYSLVSAFPLAEKRQMIDVAKEMFYIEKVFGTNKISLVTELLIARMSKRESGLCLTERWIAVLLIHIILSAEATQSSSRKQPKEERPFCKAFSTEAFVTNFQEFVRCLKSRRNKQKMYWMRIVWSSCLLEESLSAIDACNFWTKLEVRTSAIPTTLTLKRPTVVEVADDDDEIAVVANVDKNVHREEVPTIVLLSSEDESDNNDAAISDSEDSIILIGVSVNNSSANPEQNIPKPRRTKRISRKKQWYKDFQTNRIKWWTAAFSMSGKDIAKMKEKYNFQKGSESVMTNKDKLSFAMGKFRHTVLSLFPLRNADQCLRAAKEAFFLAEDLGELVIMEIAAFLAKGLREGFDTKPAEVKFISRLTAFLIIHIIIAVEGIEPSFLTYINKQWFINYFFREDVVKTAEDLSLAINDDGIPQILQFLILTWLPNGAYRFSRSIRSLYNSKDDLEAGFLKDIYEYTVTKYNVRVAMIAREYAVAEIVRNATKRKNEIQISSSDEEDNDCIVYSDCESDCGIGDPDEVNRVRCEPQMARHSPKRKAVSEKQKRDKIKEKLLAKTAENLQSLFIPDKITTVPSTSNKTSKNSTEVPTESKSKRQYSSRTVSSSANTTSSELLGVNGKPLQQTGSRCEKAMDNIRKMLRERNGEHKNSKDAEDSVPRSSTSSGIKIIENVQSQDFVDNLINGNLDFIFTENGVQVTTIHPK